jgi:hypothetical protein
MWQDSVWDPSDLEEKVSLNQTPASGMLVGVLQERGVGR